LVGSIAYNLINKITESVFGKQKLLTLRRKLRTIEDIRKEFKNETEKLKWDKIQKNGKLTEWEDTIKEYSDQRVGLAHPKSLDSDDEENVPSPDQLKGVIKDVYHNRNSKILRENGFEIVDFLDLLSQDLKRDILD